MARKLSTTKVSRQAKLQAILSGIASTYPNVTTLTIGGKTYVLADFVKLIQTELDAIASSAKAKDAYRLEVQTERNARGTLSPVLRQFKNYVLGQLGDTQDAIAALGAFGFSPRKVGKKTVAEKAEALKKAEATREAGQAAPTAKAEASPASNGTAVTPKA
jgi:hypothetical protein